jgi:hypothetical protein
METHYVYDDKVPPEHESFQEESWEETISRFWLSLSSDSSCSSAIIEVTFEKDTTQSVCWGRWVVFNFEIADAWRKMDGFLF